jgi:phosphomannomutase
MNFRAKDSVKKLKQLKSRYSDGRISKIDGLRIDFKDWWFLARASNTEPVLRLIVEAKTKELMEKKIKEISSLILRP